LSFLSYVWLIEYLLANAGARFMPGNPSVHHVVQSRSRQLTCSILLGERRCVIEQLPNAEKSAANRLTAKVSNFDHKSSQNYYEITPLTS
jgi:hypothetical protein